MECSDSNAINKNVNEKITSLETLGSYIASTDNTINNTYISEVPQLCRDEPCMLGIDEAGRGPVLGPMVYGIAYCPVKNKKMLENLGCADSKELTEEQREKIFENITREGDEPVGHIGWAVNLISPHTISTSMLGRTKCSLNELSMNAAIDLVNAAIDAGVNISEVYVDTVGPWEKYQDKLKKLFPQFEITVSKKADSIYPIVSAASICAKVTRDNALKVWKFPEGLQLTNKDFGSGYPGDPITRNFLNNNVDKVFGFPRLVRFSWSTADKVLDEQACLMEFDDTVQEKSKYSGPKLTQFFKGIVNGEVKRDQCRLFKENYMDSVVEF